MINLRCRRAGIYMKRLHRCCIVSATQATAISPFWNLYRGGSLTWMSDRERKRRSHKFTPRFPAFFCGSKTPSPRQPVPLKPSSHRRRTLALLPDHVARRSLTARSTISNFFLRFRSNPPLPWSLPHSHWQRAIFETGEKEAGKRDKIHVCPPRNAPTYTTSSNFESRGCWLPFRPRWPKHSAK